MQMDSSDEQKVSLLAIMIAFLVLLQENDIPYEVIRYNINGVLIIAPPALVMPIHNGVEIPVRPLNINRSE